MSIPVEVLEVEVLRLPTQERTRLLDRLIASLDLDAAQQQAIDAAWECLADEREADGQAPVDGKTVIDSLRRSAA